jgi:uncharacterized protein YjbI with pentapeptide repeats
MVIITPIYEKKDIKYMYINYPYTNNDIEPIKNQNEDTVLLQRSNNGTLFFRIKDKGWYELNNSNTHSLNIYDNYILKTSYEVTESLNKALYKNIVEQSNCYTKKPIANQVQVSQEDWNEYQTYIDSIENLNNSLPEESKRLPKPIREYMLLKAFNKKETITGNELNQFLEEHKDDPVILLNLTLGSQKGTIKLKNLDFQGIIFEKNIIQNIEFDNLNFSDIRFLNNKIQNSKFNICSFKSSDMRKNIFTDCQFNSTSFERSDLSDTKIITSKTYIDRNSIEKTLKPYLGAIFTSCVCKLLEISGYSFSKTQFKDCDLSSTIINNCDLTKADITKTGTQTTETNTENKLSTNKGPSFLENILSTATKTARIATKATNIAATTIANFTDETNPKSIKKYKKPKFKATGKIVNRITIQRKEREASSKSKEPR